MTAVSSEQYESLKKKLRKLQALAEQGYRGISGGTGDDTQKPPKFRRTGAEIITCPMKTFEADRRRFREK